MQVKCPKLSTDDIVTHRELINKSNANVFPIMNNLTDDDVGQLLSELNLGPPPGFCWLLKPDNDTITAILIDIEATLHSIQYLNSANKTSYLMNTLALDPDIILSIAEKTVAQSDCAEWFYARKHRLTCKVKLLSLKKSRNSF